MDSGDKTRELAAGMAVVFCTNKIALETRRDLESIFATSPQRPQGQKIK